VAQISSGDADVDRTRPEKVRLPRDPTHPPFSKADVGRREAFFREASGFTKLLLADTRRGSFLVNTWDVKVGLILFRRGARGEQRLFTMGTGILRHLGLGERLEGSTFLEVGGNIGTSCISALLADSFADAVVLEPHPDNCRLLRANAALNDLHERIAVINAAASSADGEAQLAISGINSGGHRIAQPGMFSRKEKQTITVEIVALDTLVERGIIDIARLGLWFMDAQGHEGEIMLGARRLLEAGTPILLEYKPTSLAAAGGLETLHDQLTRHYTHVVEMSSVTEQDPSTYELTEVARLPEIAERFTKGFGDLLAVRLP